MLSIWLRMAGGVGRGSFSAIGVLLGLVTLCGAPRAALAHDLAFTGADLRLGADGSFELVVTCHPDAVYAGLSPQSSVTDEAYARIASQSDAWRAERREYLVDYFQRKFVVLIDDSPVACAVSFPQEGGATTADMIDGRLFGQRVLLAGRLPSGAGAITVHPAAGFSPVSLTIEAPWSTENYQQTLADGAASTPYPLRPPGDSGGATVSPPRQSVVSVIFEYLRLGFEHIVPKGLDHILFVLGLFLLSEKLGALLWQVSAFTVAHTISLALASLGIVQLSPGIVEPLIAASIAYVGIENICTKKLNPWRPVVVFIFGLLHGMGFAGVLAGLGLPEGRFVPALVSFNVGVELGQLSVIAGALLLVGWFRKNKWYRARIEIPGSIAIAAMGIFWAVQRTFF